MSPSPALYHLLIALGTYLAHIESTLHIPATLRFFPPCGPPDEMHMPALMFAVAPLHAYIMLPGLAYLGRQGRWTWTRCIKLHVQCLGMFWFVILLLRVRDGGC